MSQEKNDKNKKGHKHTKPPPPPPLISVFIDDPQEGQVISINPSHTAKGRTTVVNGAVVKSMGRQVNRTSNPPMTGNPIAINAPYDSWSTVLDSTDCSTSGGYTLTVYAVDATSGNTFGAWVDFIVL